MSKILSRVCVLLVILILSGCTVLPTYPTYGGPGYYRPAPYYPWHHSHGYRHWR